MPPLSPGLGRVRAQAPSLEPLEARLVPASVGYVFNDLGTVAQTYGRQLPSGTAPPSVAIDGNSSRFALAWTEMVSGNQAVVRALVLNADGRPLTGIITVTDTALLWSASRPVKVDVAIDPQGRFAVAYDGLPNASGQADIGIRRYNADGTPYESLFVQGLANRLEINPSIDLSDTGRIVLAYDQVATTTTPMTHRLTVTAYASFQNLASNTTTSISSVGGEIYPHVAFNAEGRYLLGGTTLTTQASTPLRVFTQLGNLSPSTTIRASALQPLALTNVPGSADWRVAYLDTADGTTQLVSRVVSAGATQSTAPMLGPKMVLDSGVSAQSPPSLAVDARGNLAVTYLREGRGGLQLVVGFFTPEGHRTDTVVIAGAVAGMPHGVARGDTVFGSMVFHAPRSQAGAGTGDLARFQVDAGVFGPPPPAPAAPPPVVEVAPGVDYRPLAVALEQAGRQFSAAIPLQRVEVPGLAQVADLLFGGVAAQSALFTPEEGLGAGGDYQGPAELAGLDEALFLDLNDNGRFGPGEPRLVPDGQGRYRPEGGRTGDAPTLPAQAGQAGAGGQTAAHEGAQVEGAAA